LNSLAILGGSGFVGKSIIDYIDKKNGTNLKIKKIYLFQRKKFSYNSINIKLVFINKDFLNVKNFPEVNYIIYGLKSNTLKKSKAIFTHLKKKIFFFKKKPKILFLSSGAVYGKNPSKINTLEKKKIDLKLISSFNNYKKKYAKEKFYLEKRFLNLQKHQFEVSIARCFTFVGKHIPQNSIYVIGNLIKSIFQNKSLNIKSNYLVIRSYMHEEQFVKCLMMILSSNKSNGEIFNVGSDDEINIHDLVYKLSKKYSLKVKKKSYNNKIKDIYVPNIDKLRNKFNIKSNYKSYLSIIKTLDFFKLKKMKSISRKKI